MHFKKNIAYFLCLFLIFSDSIKAQETSLTEPISLNKESSINSECVKLLQTISTKVKPPLAEIEQICTAAQTVPVCTSRENRTIFHFDKVSKSAKAKKVLVFSLIHGDEIPAGEAAFFLAQASA
jgi:hypothetical protein